jgi:general secretion pathway protein D
VVSGKPVSEEPHLSDAAIGVARAGFVTVEGAGFVKIVPEAEGKTNPTPVTQGPVAARGDQLVTQVYTLKNESAAQMVNVLRPLIAPNNTIAAYPSTNSLIITDYADNLRRIERIIESIDNAAGAEPMVVPIRNASAMDYRTDAEPDPRRAGVERAHRRRTSRRSAWSSFPKRARTRSCCAPRIRSGWRGSAR